MNSYNRKEVEKEAIKYFNGDTLSRDVWINKYALKDSNDNIYELSPTDMHNRLASELNRIEKKYPNPLSKEKIFDLIKDFKYIVPQGGSMSGIGNNLQTVSLSNCFEENTIVFTTKGIKKIKDIKINDNVVTQTGEINKVVQLHKNKLDGRKLFNLKVYKTPNINVTDNHKFLSISQEQLKWKLPLQENTVDYLRTGDYIAIPSQKDFNNYTDIDLNDYIPDQFTYESKNYILNYIDNNQIQLSTTWLNNSKICKKEHYTVNRKWEIDEDFMYFIGLWYGDGCIFSDKKGKGIRARTGKHKNGVRGITFTFNINEKDTSDFVINYGNKLFGLEADVNINEEQNTIQIVYHSSIIGIVFEKLFGRYFDGKKLNQMFYTMNNELIKKFTLGLIDSDGTITKEKDLRITLANDNLIREIYHLLRNRGVVVGYSKNESCSRIDFPKNSELILESNRFYSDHRNKNINESKNNFILEYDGYILLRIMNKNISDLNPEYVYTFGVENIHSYGVEGLISMNCFVIGNTSDSYGGIMQTDQEQVQLMKRRGGVGGDLSHIRPKGSPVKNSALTSTGVVPFMERYSNSTREVAQDGRRGALMLSISVEHPDAEDFIDAKMVKGKVTGANVSVKINDEFMKCVLEDKPYTQQYPIGSKEPLVIKEINAKKLWKKIIHNAWKSAEPGILFWDTIQRESIPDMYPEHGFTSVSTNPCGEIILCPNDSCRLLAINLYSYVNNPFKDNANFNFKLFSEHVNIAQRLMDDIVDLEIEKIDTILEKIKSDPEPDDIKTVESNLWEKIKEKAIQGRRTGIGITAEGDMLAALGYKYGTTKATDFAESVHKALAVSAYKASIEMAADRGSFQVWDFEKEFNNPFMQRIWAELDKEYREMYSKTGRRNIALLTIAPTGTVSLMTQTTSGIEPVFLPVYKRRRKINPNDKDVTVNFTDEVGDSWEEYNVFHPKFKIWAELNDYNIEELEKMNESELEPIIALSPYFEATSNDVNWLEKVNMQGKIQKWVDHSISVTVNLPKEADEDLVGKVYETGWNVGCKGITVYRDGSRTGVLVKADNKPNVFQENHAPRRPKTLQCDVIRFTNKGEKWIGFLGLYENRPFEVFTGLQEAANIPNYIEVGEIIKCRAAENDGHSRYDFKYIDRDGYTQEFRGISRAFNREFWNTGRLVSGILRHGMPLPNVLALLDKLDFGDSEMIATWRTGVKRMIKKYIKDGTKIVGDECPTCHSNNIVFKEGCKTCLDCNWSKCD